MRVLGILIVVLIIVVVLMAMIHRSYIRPRQAKRHVEEMLEENRRLDEIQHDLHTRQKER